MHRTNSSGERLPHISHEIAVVTVLDKTGSEYLYESAIKTIRCYCAYHNYTYRILHANSNHYWNKICVQNSFLFKRHCIAAFYIIQSPQIYHLFIDGDIAVINPKHRIEEFLITDKDIIFYNRLWGFEIMAGSFIARKSEFAFKFLLNWANYDWMIYHSSIHHDAAVGFKLATDNIILHNAVLDFAPINKKICEDILRHSNSLTHVFIYVACMRDLMKKYATWSKHIKILPKGKSWSRDGWLTYSKWSDKDFMLHGWHEEYRPLQPLAQKNGSLHYGIWLYPFLSEMDFSQHKCESSNEWLYVKEMKHSNLEVDFAFKQIIEHVKQQHLIAMENAKFFWKNGDFPKGPTFKLLFAGLERYPDFIADLDVNKLKPIVI